MIEISVKSNIDQIARALTDFAQRQVPFATALALNDLASDVKDAEVANLEKQLDRPTPFTKKAIRIRKASKKNPIATIFMMDKTAEYLAPYEFGGKNKLNSQALLKPVDIALNEFGNIPRNKLAQLRNRKDIFIGPVQTKAGVINGVWQRSTPQKVLRNGKLKEVRGANHSGTLKLLIKFEDAHDAKQRLGYRDLANRIVNQNFNRRFGQALGRAIAKARG